MPCASTKNCRVFDHTFNLFKGSTLGAYKITAVIGS